MKFISIVGALIAVALAALFIIKDSDALLLIVIAAFLGSCILNSKGGVGLLTPSCVRAYPRPIRIF